ncbi:response regulator transcription factor [Paenibacillus dakarensis]|uniref:response regulator transcription factor n=1 Tax=Paenibacillus dakarensis TaxID=1527293 RepID=UPI0006D5B564|nr:response regulator transcription factor [Paenibacillus dakarensis]
MHKVFIVDDEPFILEGLTSIIDWEELGIHLYGKASGGSEAFEILENQEVDILITDIMMRDMNGLQLIEQLKPIHPQMKFIILSGYNEFEYVKQGMRLGIENYLLKPVNINELRETVESTVQKIEYADRQAYIEQNQLDILRDNIFFRWVTGRFENEELRNRLNFLGINTSFPVYATAVIKTVHDSSMQANSSLNSEQELNRQVYQLCRNLSEKTGNPLCFSDQDGDMVIITPGNSHDIVKAEALSTLSLIKYEAKSLCHVKVLVTLGSLEPGFLGVSSSYKHAKRLQEFFLINEENEIISYDQINAAALQNGTPSVDWFEFEHLLLSKNKKNIHTFIDSIFTELQFAGSATPAQIHNCAVEMILCTKQVVKDNKLNHEQATSEYKQLFTTIFKAHTIQQLTTHVKFIADSAVDYLCTQDDEFSPVVKQVLHLIKTQYMNELSLKTLSPSLNIHPFYLGQLFQKETGISFSDYVNSFRIKKAQKLLLSTTLKTNEISNHVGYLEAGYFYKQFKKYSGISPTEYRNRKK